MKSKLEEVILLHKKCDSCSCIVYEEVLCFSCEVQKNLIQEKYKNIYLEGKSIILKISSSYEYVIELSSCRTKELLLQKIWELNQKTWMSRSLTYEVIKLVCEKNNLNLYE